MTALTWKSGKIVFVCLGKTKGTLCPSSILVFSMTGKVEQRVESVEFH